MEKSEQMTKSQIRSSSLAKRSQIDVEARSHLDLLVFERAHKNVAFQLCSAVHLYRSTQFEVDTKPFFEYAWGIGKDVYVPLTDTVSGTLQHVRVTRSTAWAKGSYGIEQPVIDGHMLKVNDVFFDEKTVVFVPLVAFDRQCNRIGYGKGYYDKFLLKSRAVTIGLAYELQKVQTIQTELHDVSLSCVATEERWYTP